MELIAVFLLLFVWKKITDDFGKIGDYTFNEFVVYYLLFGIFRNFKASDLTGDLDTLVRSGNLSILLKKPINILGYLIANDLAILVIELMISIIIFTPILLLVTGFRSSIYLNFENLIWIVIYCTLTFFFTSFFYLIVGTFSFWTKTIGGLQNLVQQTIDILRGAWFPLDLAPLWFKNLVFALPFSYTLFAPIKMLLGGEINNLKGLTVLLISCLATYFILVWLFQKGVKKYEAYGN